MRPHSRDEFEVALICALPLELDAVDALLDEHYDGFGAPYGEHLGDTNWYRTGRLGTHHVVLMCLPGMGKGRAASAASSLHVSFPKIRLAFLVGICGGVPSPSEKTEVILGDVIVSDKVLQYDFGRQYPDGFRWKGESKETLGTSSTGRIMRGFLSGLKTYKMHQQMQDDIFENQQILATQHDGRWKYPGSSQDQLFQSSYRHKHYHQHPSVACICASCQCSSDPVCELALENDCRKVGCIGPLVSRARLSKDHPKPYIHFGSVASGDTVMKSGEHRDSLAKAQNVLGFEMEGAGIWDNLSCIVIKGVCDYADSHKNKVWQNYAAATAASCCKAFLRHWAPVSSTPEELTTLDHDVGTEESEETLSSEQRKELYALLRFDQINARQMSLKSAQGKTCRWMLQNPLYSDWLDFERSRNNNAFFWIKGKPGAGKSIMMKFLFQEAKKKSKGSVVISFFFNARGSDLEKSTMGLYRSLLYQLLEKMPNLISCLDQCGTESLELIRNGGWPLELLKEVITHVIDRIGERRIFCFIDALDECPEDDIRDMVSFFEDTNSRRELCGFRVCFSSRHYPEITIKTGLQLALEREQHHGDDISLYIDSQLRIIDEIQAEDIKTEILRKSSGIFLWVALVVPMLNKEHDRGRVKTLRQKLDEIPSGLHELFLDILTRDCTDTEETVLCLQIILFAQQPLTPLELQTAVLTGLNDRVQDPHDEAETPWEVLRKFILDVSKGLAEIAGGVKPTVQFIHESVRDFLLKEGGLNKLWIESRNIEGKSHDKMTKICLRQLDALQHKEVELFCGPSPDFSLSTRHLQKINPRHLERVFPFLCYAVENVLHHANSAQYFGVSQKSFFDNFSLSDRWFSVYNGLQKYRNQRYGIETHILYILAEKGLAALIKIHPDKAKHLSLTCSARFRIPLLAALFSSNQESARALCDIDLQDEPHLGANRLKNLDQPAAMRLSDFKHTRRLASYLAEFGDTTLLRKILESREHLDYDQINKKRDKRDNPLIHASSEAIVELLLEFSGDLFENDALSTDVSFESTLAPGRGEDDYTRIMMTQNIGILGRHGYISFIEYAAERGFERMTSLAIASMSVGQFTVNEKTFDKPVFPFCCAARGRINHRGRLAVMKLLYAANQPLNEIDPSGMTPLHYAVATAHNDEVVKFLASLDDIDLEMTTSLQGMTPLAFAVYNKQKSYVQLLLAAGANPRATIDATYNESNLLMYCVQNRYSGIFTLLLNSARCELDAVDLDGRTALSWCASSRSDEATRMMSSLLESPAVNPNLRDNSGYTALEWAVRDPQLTKVAMILSRTHHPDLEDHEGINLLGTVINLYRQDGRLERLETARLLLASGHLNSQSYTYLQGPLLYLAESNTERELKEISQMVKTYLAGGDLSTPLLAY